MIQPLTSDAHQVIVMYHLGIPTAEYRAKLARKKAIAIALLLIIGLGFLALAIYGFYSTELSTVIIILILSLLILATGVWTIMDTVLSRDIHVYSCPGGLLYQHSGKTEAIRWDQVESFWRRVVKTYSSGIYTGTTHRYKLRRADGAIFTFNDNIHNVVALGNTIASETTRALWPRYMAAYQAGQTLFFGKISLNQQGASKGKQVLPWSQVKELQVSRGGYLSLKKEGNRQRNWLATPASEIPNVEVFMALVNYILSSR